MIDTNFIYVIQNDKRFQFTHMAVDEEFIIENFNCDIMFDSQNNLFKTLMWKCCRIVLEKELYKHVTTTKLMKEFQNQLRTK